LASEPALAAAVTLAGPVAHDRLLALMAASDVLLSPSRMESFGLALAEARALGVPIVACAGGNSAAHVEARAGGVLVADEAALAAECARLAQDREERRRRRAAARAGRPAPRGWADAARDLLAAHLPGRE
jgi:glycosyltransferase involved in cell wall biosynthesis